MFIKKRNSLSDAYEVKRGSLIKSPPFYTFNNRSSWKVRLFRLLKTYENKFILSYYASDGVSEKIKGTIKISNIKSIKKEFNSEKTSAILKNFNITHKKVIHIKTEDRDFYLSDEIEEELDDWYTCLTNAWINENTSMDESRPAISLPMTSSTIAETLNDDRPKSYPEHNPKSGNQMAEATDRQRSHTDSDLILRTLPAANQQQCLNMAKIDYANRSTLPFTDPQLNDFNAKCSACTSPLQHMDDEDSDPEPDNISETNIYDVPRRLYQCRNLSPESGCLSNTSSDSEDLYVHMKSVDTQNPDNVNNEDISVEAEPANNSLSVKKVEKKLCLSEEETSVPNKQKEPPKSEGSTVPLKKLQGSRLNKIYLLALRYEKENQDDLVEVEIVVPKEHLKNFLAVVEVGEYLCVSKWNGPKEIGCLFHHGDHIKAVNNIGSKSPEWYMELLNNSLSNEVRLTVVRNPRANVFHTEGCSCRNS